MPAAAVKVVGARELRRELKKAGVDIKTLREAPRAASTIVSNAAKSSGPKRSGDLRGSVRPANQVARAIVYAGSARVPYAGPIHWGWRARNISPQPWVSEAAQSTESTWLPAYEKEIDRIIGQVKGAG